MHTTRTAGVVLLAAAATAALAGCTGPEQNAAATPTATRTVSATAAPATERTPSATPSATPSCGPSDGATAARAGIAALPAPDGLPTRFDASTADYSGYSACAALSWSTVTVPLATASSPVAVLLFHDGRYLGTATKQAYGFVPDIARKSDDAVQVEYHYPLATDSNANPTGHATAVFTWDSGSQRVVMTGDTPPTS